MRIHEARGPGVVHGASDHTVPRQLVRSTLPQNSRGKWTIGVSTDDPDSMVLGARLRATRRLRGWSLHDVELRSRQAFKASALSAYERGERHISVDRLLALADFYETPTVPLLRRRHQDLELDLTPLASGARLAIDLAHVDREGDPDGVLVARFASWIARQRREPPGGTFPVRAADVEVLAAVLGRTPGEFMAGRVPGIVLSP